MRTRLLQAILISLTLHVATAFLVTIAFHSTVQPTQLNVNFLGAILHAQDIEFAQSDLGETIKNQFQSDMLGEQNLVFTWVKRNNYSKAKSLQALWTVKPDFKPVQEYIVIPKIHDNSLDLLKIPILPYEPVKLYE